MRYALWISLVIAILAVLFALQNATPVTVRLGPFEMQGSLALILLLTLAIGVLIGYLATLGRRVKAGWKIFTLKRQVRDSEKQESTRLVEGETAAAVDAAQTATDTPPAPVVPPAKPEEKRPEAGS